jgi:CheY-like chemotaxis protein
MKKVLVIEDNPDNLRLITYVLKRNGYEVLFAMTGEEGVDRADRETPEIILVDINLPGIDGLETTRRILASGSCPRAAIIAITSYAMKGDREKVMAAGCKGYFEKPIDPLTIMGRIEEIAGKTS